MIFIDRKSIYFVIFILAIGAALSGLLFLYFKKPVAVQTNGFSYAHILHGPTVDIPVSIADTEQAREQGLSDTQSLPTGSGMLFIFDTPDTYGFWMKGMQYPLDIVWLDSNLTIVDIAHSVSPASYPKIFYPTHAAKYVLEVNAEFSTDRALEIGQKMTILAK